MLSGICGIALGDTCTFFALRRIGVRNTILIQNLAPPLTGILSFIAFGTTIHFLGWLGMFITMGGVVIVVNE